MRDATSLAEIYRGVFPSRRLSLFGVGTVRDYIRLALNARRPIALVLESTDEALVGFAIGYLGAPPLRSSRAVRYLPSLVWRIGAALMRKPSLVREVVSSASTQSSTLGTDRDAFLSAIALVPEGRGSGSGKRLLAAFVAKAREGGAERVVLEVDRDAESAIELYHNAGFIECSAQPAGPCATMMLRLRNGAGDGREVLAR